MKTLPARKVPVYKTIDTGNARQGRIVPLGISRYGGYPIFPLLQGGRVFPVQVANRVKASVVERLPDRETHGITLAGFNLAVIKFAGCHQKKVAAMRKLIPEYLVETTFGRPSVGLYSLIPLTRENLQAKEEKPDNTLGLYFSCPDGNRTLIFNHTVFDDEALAASAVLAHACQRYLIEFNIRIDDPTIVQWLMGLTADKLTTRPVLFFALGYTESDARAQYEQVFDFSTLMPDQQKFLSRFEQNTIEQEPDRKHLLQWVHSGVGIRKIQVKRFRDFSELYNPHTNRAMDLWGIELRPIEVIQYLARYMLQSVMIFPQLARQSEAGQPDTIKYLDIVTHRIGEVSLDGADKILGLRN